MVPTRECEECASGDALTDGPVIIVSISTSQPESLYSWKLREGSLPALLITGQQRPAPAGLHVRRLEALLQHEGVRHAAVAVARHLLAHVADGNLAAVVPKLQNVKTN